MKQFAGAGVVLAVAVAAMRFVGAPQSTPPDAKVGGQITQRQERPKTLGPKAESSYQGGCTVFDADPPAVPSKNPGPKYPKDANRGAAKAVIDRFFAIHEAAPTTAQAHPEPSPLKAMSRVRYAIALAPDPRHTNLSLMFDREMVAIQQSAQDEGYSYNSSWLPWKSEASAFPLYADAQQSDDETDQREACPGVLLFRKSVNDPKQSTDPADRAEPYLQALVVLVVGEQPTGGLNENQWANAIAWLNGNASLMESPHQPLGKDGKPLPDLPRPLYILGPTFSGSLVSLQRDLAIPTHLPEAQSTESVVFPSRSTQVRILSGSISSCSSTRWFQQRVAETRPSGTLFGSFHENDEVQIYRLLNYLDQQGTDPKDVAILSEDETAYAAAPAVPVAVETGVPPSKQPDVHSRQNPPPACEFPYDRAKGPVRFSYPRDISAIRTAYEKESVFSTSSGHGAHPILQESDSLVAEPSNASDTIPAFGGAVTPIAQEAVLYGLVSHLRSHHSQYLVLRCTNPLDFLFLTQFFHRAYPEGRIVTVGADLLFRREIDTTEFRGVLALSNYPLLPRDQHWAALSTFKPTDIFPPHTHRVPDSHMEGMYLAGRYLFGDEAGWPQPSADRDHPITLPFKPYLPDFADPFWLHAPDETLAAIQAPTWLSVVGRDGYWPLAVLNKVSTPMRCLDEDHVDREKNSADCAAQKHDPPPYMLVQISGADPAGNAAHYDLDPRDGKRFSSTLLLKMHLAWQICAVCATFLLLYQLFGVWKGPELTSSGLFALFRPVSAPSQSILLGINCALAASILFELLTLGAALPAFGQVFGGSRSLAASVWLWLIWPILACIITAAAPPPLRSKARNIALGILAVLLVWHLLNCFAGVPFAAVGRLDLFGSLFGGAPLLGFFAAVWLLLTYVIFWRLVATWTPQRLFTAIVLLLALLSAGCLLFWTIHARLISANDLPFFYRISHLTSGVSPMAPILFLLAGFYLWTWQALAGNTLLCYGHPLLPVLPNARYRIGARMGRRIIRVARPLYLGRQITVLPICLMIVAAAYLKFLGPPLLSLEGRSYDYALNIALLVAFLITIAESARLFFTWKELQRTLMALNRLRLRRTFARLRAIESSTLWSVSGNVQRVQYQFFAQQLEAAKRLSILGGGRLPRVDDVCYYGCRFVEASASRTATGALWEKPVGPNPPRNTAPAARIRYVLNKAAAEVLTELFKHWDTETTSLSLEPPPLEKTGTKSPEGDGDGHTADMELSNNAFIRAAEEFVCFHYIAFIQNILARMRTMVLSMGFLFVSVCFAISFYPFVPRTGIGMWMMVNLFVISAVVVYVYAGMERDATLSYITNTRPGNLGTEFYIKTATFLAGPVIGLLTTQFPAISESVLGWLQPGLDALK